ncbi:MAG: flagellar biosynthesis protein FlhA [Parvibaculum sp.]|uniref:flagellar biosynthesis protein FlhA n=1 Tax=Parvibaculum sp. TaxID=2024848 RepID=UPI00284BE6FF|nr:flagellar biosynthesis protein FlhA [Parvibaculum sp.]MDR3498951.1 flagellar biosynthesis protein FlhA [Parvibaculum sp.]
MSDASVANAKTGGPLSGFGFPGLTAGGVLGNFAKRGDLALAIGVMTIIVVLILPMPAFLLDFSLAISITFSVLVLMTSLFIQKPLEFSAFPTVLLIATMLRLALNLASTRLILAHGHDGTDAAGKVIQAFGHFVMQGNFVIGVIVFAILVIVNFVVITKGSGRIAEVAARFTLDAMPGKQMAIDADLSAGLIDEKVARKRRSDLENESAFFGAMDGASKFVRGDAVAGLLITFINVIGGIIVGVAQNGLSFTDAAHTYTILTVGDGLVSQIPALIVSTAAGLLVSKAGVEGAADQALFDQLSGYPQALGMSSVVMGIMAFLPGLPAIPFLLLAGGAGSVAYYVTKNRKEKAAEEVRAETEKTEAVPVADEPISTALKMDELRLEIGYALLPLINGKDHQKLTDQIKALRRQLATDMGFVMPSVRILDNVQIEANGYAIRVKEVEAGRGEVYVNQLLVMDPHGGRIELPGLHTTEPAFGLPATWIDEGLREEASFRGYTVVDPPTVLTTHLTEIIRDNMADLLSYAEVQKLIDELGKEHKKLVDDIVPAQITVTGIQRVLQTLLNERISIRDLPTIMEGIAEAVGHTQSLNLITEHVRARLARQICASHSDANGTLPLLTLSPRWEQSFAESLVGQGEEKQLAMQPSKLQEFIALVRDAFEEAGRVGDVPVLLTSPGVRPYVRSIIERFRPQTFVMSQNEIHPRVRLRTIGTV